MRLFARVENGVVQELYSPPAALANFTLDQIFAPGMGWRDISDVSPAPKVGWLVQGDSFTAPPPTPASPPTPAPSLTTLADQLASLKIQIGKLGEQIASLGAAASGGTTGTG